MPIQFNQSFIFFSGCLKAIIQAFQTGILSYSGEFAGLNELALILQLTQAAL